MGKSKTIGTIHIAVANKKFDRDNLFEDVATNIYPALLNKSEIMGISNNKMMECWHELLKYLYKSKALNIPELINQINYYKVNK